MTTISLADNRILDTDYVVPAYDASGKRILDKELLKDHYRTAGDPWVCGAYNDYGKRLITDEEVRAHYKIPNPTIENLDPKRHSKLWWWAHNNKCASFFMKLYYKFKLWLFDPNK